MPTNRARTGTELNNKREGWSSVRTRKLGMTRVNVFKHAAPTLAMQVRPERESRKIQSLGMICGYRPIQPVRISLCGSEVVVVGGDDFWRALVSPPVLFSGCNISRAIKTRSFLKAEVSLIQCGVDGAAESSLKQDGPLATCIASATAGLKDVLYHN